MFTLRIRWPWVAPTIKNRKEFDGLLSTNLFLSLALFSTICHKQEISYSGVKFSLMFNGREAVIVGHIYMYKCI